VVTRLLAFLSFLAATACGVAPPSPKGTPVGGFDYSQATVERFVSACIQQPGSTVARCACLLDQFRAAAPESKLLEAFRSDGLVNFPTKFLDACDIKVESVGAQTSLPEALPPQPARQASDVESCIAEKTAAAMAASSDGSLAIEVFDRLRKECGG
jgi:hypothetical protein